MKKKPKCKCWKTTLPQAGRVVVRCEKHRGKPSKSGRLVCYLNEDYLKLAARRLQQQSLFAEVVT